MAQPTNGPSRCRPLRRVPRNLCPLGPVSGCVARHLPWNGDSSRHVQRRMHNVQDFFAAYDRFTASSATSGHDAFFAPTFMSASADGVRILTPDQLAAVAPRMRAVLD